MASGPTSFGPFGAGATPRAESSGESEQGLQPEVITPETEQESEYWKRYRAWRRFRRSGRPFRRRRFMRWRRRYGGSGGGYSGGGSSGGGSYGTSYTSMSSDEPDDGDSGGD